METINLLTDTFEKDYLYVLGFGKRMVLHGQNYFLQVNKKLYEEIEINETVSLLDLEGVLIAYICVSSIFCNEDRYYFGGEVIGIEPHHSGKEVMNLPI